MGKTPVRIAAMLGALALLLQGAEAPSPILPGTGYDQFFMDLHAKDSFERDLVADWAEVNGTTWHVLWPTMPWDKNAASWYACARQYFSKAPIPPGSSSGYEPYRGNSDAIRHWVHANEKALICLRKGLAMDYCRAPPVSPKCPCSTTYANSASWRTRLFRNTVPAWLNTRRTMMLCFGS